METRTGIISTVKLFWFSPLPRLIATFFTKIPKCLFGSSKNPNTMVPSRTSLVHGWSTKPFQKVRKLGLETRAKFTRGTIDHEVGSEQAVTTKGGKDRARRVVQIYLVGLNGWGGPSQLGAVKRQRALLQKSDPSSNKSHTAKWLTPRQTATSHGPCRIIWISSGSFAFLPSGVVWTCLDNEC